MIVRASPRHPLRSQVFLPNGVMLGLCSSCSEVHEYEPPPAASAVVVTLPQRDIANIERRQDRSPNRAQRRSRQH